MNLMDMELNDVNALVEALGEKSFRGVQIFGWLSRGIPPIEMTNLPQSLRERLMEQTFGGVKLHTRLVSQKDGTKKYLFELEDGNIVEAVLMHNNYGNTLCLSTQVGCRMGCAFCASTLNGCVRNMSAGEMLSCVAWVERDIPCPSERSRAITNIVLMGSGEPLDNYDNVTRFLRLITCTGGLNISPRNISLSTCGIVPKMKELRVDAPNVNLCISLHAPVDSLRSLIMPINNTYGIHEVLMQAREHAILTKRRVIIEYALIDGFNDDIVHVKLLAKRLRPVHCHVNLIPLNDVPERSLKGSPRAKVDAFLEALIHEGVSATVRREHGNDISGACGQLRRSVLEES